MSTPQRLTLLASLTAKLLVAGLATLWARTKQQPRWTQPPSVSTPNSGQPFTGQRWWTTGMSDTDCGTPEHVTALDITDTDLVDFWRLAADDAAQHRASACGGCGDKRGRCRHRRANLDECDALLDQWLARNGRPA